MVVTIIVAGKNDIACNVLKYLTTKEKDENMYTGPSWFADSMKDVY